MAAKELTDDQCKEAVRTLEACGHNVWHSAERLQISRGAMQNRLQTAKQRGIVPGPKPEKPKPEPPPATRLPISADECYEVLDRWIGRKRIPPSKPPKWRGGKTQRIVVASDLHAPFHEPQAVAELIKEADRTDTLILNGDLMDGYSVSRFIKAEKVPMEQEIAATEAILAALAGAFRDIVIVDGNHDKPRYEKQLRGLLTPDLMHVVERLAGGNLSLIRMLASRYSNVRFQPLQVGRFTLSWMTQIGDVICTHAEKFSVVPGSALRQIDSWFTRRENLLGLKPWRIIVQAHTHQATWFLWEDDKELIECGCLCETHGYMLDARLGGLPQRRGYVTLEQVNGITTPNSLQFRSLEHLLRQTA